MHTYYHKSTGCIWYLAKRLRTLLPFAWTGFGFWYNAHLLAGDRNEMYVCHRPLNIHWMFLLQSICRRSPRQGAMLLDFVFAEVFLYCHVQLIKIYIFLPLVWSTHACSTRRLRGSWYKPLKIFLCSCWTSEHRTFKMECFQQVEFIRFVNGHTSEVTIVKTEMTFDIADAICVWMKTKFHWNPEDTAQITVTSLAYWQPFRGVFALHF